MSSIPPSLVLQAPSGPRCITLVCTGNICRSPMAEYLLRAALKEAQGGLETLIVQSCGTAAYTGDPASEHAQKALEPLNLDLSKHVSQPVCAALLAQSVAVFCMTQRHRQQLQERFSAIKVPLYLVREGVSPHSPDVPDPFGGDLETYLRCRDAIAQAIPWMVKCIQTCLEQKSPPKAGL